jgi:hypothetical protein
LRRRRRKSNFIDDDVARGAQLPPFNYEIRTLSNRADLVSDGDVLVEVVAPKTVPMHKVKLLLNGVDITASFVGDAATGKFRGLVTGLRVGDNEFVADLQRPGQGPAVRHPHHHQPCARWPVLLGSQAGPWVCATPTPVAASGNTPASNASGLTTFARHAVQYRD